MSFCTFRDVASAGPPKDQENVGLEHRFRTPHAKDAKCKTYALAKRLLCILEGPRRRHREKCKMTHFFALKGNSEWDFAVHPRRADTKIMSPERYVYKGFWGGRMDTRKHAQIVTFIKDSCRPGAPKP